MVSHTFVKSSLILRNVDGEETDHEARDIGKHVCCICQNGERPRQDATCELAAHEEEADNGHKEQLLHGAFSLRNLLQEFLVMFQSALMRIDTTFLGIIKLLFSHIVRSKLLLFTTNFLVHLTVFSLVDLLLDYRFPGLLVINLFFIINELCQRLVILLGLRQ